MPDLLALDGVTAGYGPTVVLEDVTLRLGEGEVLALIGRNGVGKTTLIGTVMGRTHLHAGSVRFAGTAVERWPPWRRARAGLAHVPQAREIFPSLSVLENLSVAARPQGWSLPDVIELFPRLAERARNGAGQLSGGEQQMLAIARALVLGPRLLLLDEPLEGLAPVLAEQVLAALGRVRARGGPAMLLVEQRPDLALAFADRVVALDRGRVVHEGPARTLAADPALLNRLLGVAA